MRLWLNTVGEVMKCGSEIIPFPVPRTPYKIFFFFLLMTDLCMCKSSHMSPVYGSQ